MLLPALQGRRALDKQKDTNGERQRLWCGSAKSLLRWYSPISGSQRRRHCSTQSLGLPLRNYLHWHFLRSQLLNQYMSRIQFSPITQFNSYLEFLWANQQCWKAVCHKDQKYCQDWDFCVPDPKVKDICAVSYDKRENKPSFHTLPTSLNPTDLKELILIILFHPGHCLGSTLDTAEFTDM